MAGSGSTEAVQSTALEYAPYIVLLPMLAFPVILFLGKIFNGNKMWKETLKEGGLIALPVMGASLLISIWLITDFIGGSGHANRRRFFSDRFGRDAGCNRLFAL